MKRYSVAIFLYNDVDVLDFAGPFEVFSLVNRHFGIQLMDLFIVGSNMDVIHSRSQLSLNPKFDITNSPQPDIIILPGGPGVYNEINNEKVILWIKEICHKATLILSICSGIFFLAKSGLIEEMNVTTHHGDFERLKAMSPSVNIIENQRFCDNGKVLTSAGISAGIDLSLHVINKLYGLEIAEVVSKWMEYNWQPNEA